LRTLEEFWFPVGRHLNRIAPRSQEKNKVKETRARGAQG
jgi:hypothetical protein